MAALTKGKLVYSIYRALTFGISPLVYLHLRWRKLRGLEHPHRWPERLGRPSMVRPPGPLLWFHAVSLGTMKLTFLRCEPNVGDSFIFEYLITTVDYKLGEGMAAIPVIKHCRRLRPDLNILMTTTVYSAL